MKSQNIGLVLSGGGHRGVAHIGAIKALDEFGIEPNIISGVSAGALVGALYAAGYSTEEMLTCFKRIKIFSFSRYARNKPGFVNTDTFGDFLLNYFPKNTFASLHKPLYITATNLLTGTTKVFNRGNLIQSLLASASFPGVFTPVKIGKSLFSDGGILDNFPVDPLADQCHLVYGVYASPIQKMKVEDFKHSYNVMERVYYLTVYNNSAKKFSKCDLVIRPKKLSKFSTFGSNHIDEIFEIGYKETKRKLKKYPLISV